MRYWQFDVGQGDCGLLTFPDGWRCMIDTAGRFGITSRPGQGPLGRSVGPFLRRQGIRRLDAVLLTHGHFDHTGGARYLAEELTVGRWYCGGKAGKAIAGLPDTTGIYRPVAGDTLHAWKGWALVVRYPLHPIEPADERSENDRSLVVELMHEGTGIMAWSGDLEEEGEAHLLDSGLALGPVSIWKAGHHGSNTSGSGPFLSRLDPDLILVSCGIGNKYGHPNHGPYVLGTDTLAFLRTDLAGSIRLEWDVGARGRWVTRHGKGSLPGPP